MRVINRYILLVFCHGVIIAVLSGCGEIHYYMQSAKGHLDILNDSQNIEQLIADDKLDITDKVLDKMKAAFKKK